MARKKSHKDVEFAEPRAMKRSDLRSIKILFRAPESLALWGIPYRMREGQEPSDLHRAGRTEKWIYLGGPGWYGNMSRSEQRRVKAFLRPLERRKLIPGNPYEWVDLTKESGW